MKKTIVFIGALLLTLGINNLHSQTVIRTVFTQDFETSTIGSVGAADSIGGLLLESWAEWGTTWTKTLDSSTPISGSKSLKLDLATVGDDWSAQASFHPTALINRPIDFKAGFSYRMTYKIKAAAATTIKQSFNKTGNTSTQQNVVLAGGNVVETKTFTTPILGADGIGDGFKWGWMLGAPGIATVITIDDIIIEELGEDIPPTNTGVVFSQNFEVANLGAVGAADSIGGFLLESWAPTAWTKSLETASPISGSKSFKIDLSSVGDYWTAQVSLHPASLINRPIAFKAGNWYKMTYKIKAAAATTIRHSFNKIGNSPSEQNVSLVGGNVVETKTFTTPVIEVDGMGDGFKWGWMLGAPGIATTITIDDVVIEEFSITTKAPKIEHYTLIAYGNSTQLNITTSENCKVEVLDLVGRTVTLRNLQADETLRISLNQNQGFVFVRATDRRGNIITKKVVL